MDIDFEQLETFKNFLNDLNITIDDFLKIKELVSKMKDKQIPIKSIQYVDDLPDLDWFIEKGLNPTKIKFRTTQTHPDEIIDEHECPDFVRVSGKKPIQTKRPQTIDGARLFYRTNDPNWLGKIRDWWIEKYKETEGYKNTVKDLYLNNVRYQKELHFYRKSTDKSHSKSLVLQRYRDIGEKKWTDVAKSDISDIELAKWVAGLTEEYCKTEPNVKIGISPTCT